MFVCAGDGCARRSVPDDPAVPLHGLAGAGRPQVRRGIHRLHRPGPQDQGAVWPGGTNHRPLQVYIDQSPSTAGIHWPIIVHCRYTLTNHRPLQVYIDQSPSTAGSLTNHRPLQVYWPIIVHCRYRPLQVQELITTFNNLPLRLQGIIKGHSTL